MSNASFEEKSVAMNIEERIQRLERCFISWIAVSTGEALRVAENNEEYEVVCQQLGIDLDAIKQDVVAEQSEG